MADIGASNVTYTIVERKKGEDSFQRVIADLAFGNGALTYPAGGVPLTKAKLGCPNHIAELHFIEGEAGNGYVYKYDASAATIRIYQSAAVAAHTHTGPAHTHTADHAHDLKIIGGQAAAGTNTLAHHATDILGKEAATDATITGADSATKGGVLSASVTSSSSGTGATGSSGSVSAAGLSELSGGSSAPAAATLRVLVRGF